MTRRRRHDWRHVAFSVVFIAITIGLCFAVEIPQ